MPAIVWLISFLSCIIGSLQHSVIGDVQLDLKNFTIIVKSFFGANLAVSYIIIDFIIDYAGK